MPLMITIVVLLNSIKSYNVISKIEITKMISICKRQNVGAGHDNHFSCFFKHFESDRKFIHLNCNLLLFTYILHTSFLYRIYAVV